MNSAPWALVLLLDAAPPHEQVQEVEKSFSMNQEFDSSNDAANGYVVMDKSV